MHDDIQEIKKDVKQLLVQSAIHNQILAEHKAYSLALQKEQEVQREQLKPLTQHVRFMGILLKAIGTLSIGVLIQAIVRKYL